MLFFLTMLPRTANETLKRENALRFASNKSIDELAAKIMELDKNRLNDLDVTNKQIDAILKTVKKLAAVPPGGGCRIRVGAEWRTWAEGRCLLFDDSFEHEVRNDTDRARVVLLLRFFHPDLAPAQRGAACRDAIEAKAAAERARWAPPD
mgnify:CR=1 FL=1